MLLLILFCIALCHSRTVEHLQISIRWYLPTLLHPYLISSFNCDCFVTSTDSYINTLLTHKFSYPTHLSLYSICVDITHSYDLPVHCFDNNYHIQIIAIHKLGDNYLCFLKLISTVRLHPSITDGDVPF